MEYCPVVGGPCNKSDFDTSFLKDTFFLAEPFNPEKNRERRELIVQHSIKEVLKEDYSEASLQFADKEPKEPAIFCDICRMIQSSEYGIVELTGLIPNVIIELGMMLAFGKPVFILIKRDEEKSIREKLPSDIIWKRAIPLMMNL